MNGPASLSNILSVSIMTCYLKDATFVKFVWINVFVLS